MSTPAQFRIESKYNWKNSDSEEKEEMFLKQDMYTYSDGYSWNYIPDAIMAIPNWFFGIVKAYGLHERGNGSHWFLSFILRKWRDEETENEQETIEDINNNFRHLFFINEFDIHFFIRMWIQYGSSLPWIPFSDENLGGKNEWAYYEKNAEPSFIINILTMDSPDNTYSKRGYEVYIPIDDNREIVEESISKFKEVTDIQLELKENNGKFIIFIPFATTLKHLTFKHQNLVREKLVSFRKKVKEDE